MTTKRKPYVRPMTSTWWKKLPFYRFYMLREGTARRFRLCGSALN